MYNGSWIAALLQFQSPVHLITIITAKTVYSNLKILRENFDIVLRIKGTETLMISTYPLIPKKILRYSTVNYLKSKGRPFTLNLGKAEQTETVGVI